jgi:hypothetical protein
MVIPRSWLGLAQRWYIPIPPKGNVSLIVRSISRTSRKRATVTGAAQTRPPRRRPASATWRTSSAVSGTSYRRKTISGRWSPLTCEIAAMWRLAK